MKNIYYWVKRHVLPTEASPTKITINCVIPYYKIIYIYSCISDHSFNPFFILYSLKLTMFKSLKFQLLTILDL